MRYHAPSGGIRDTFHQGLSRRAYEMLGSHPCEEGISAFGLPTRNTWRWSVPLIITTAAPTP